MTISDLCRRHTCFFLGMIDPFRCPQRCTEYGPCSWVNGDLSAHNVLHIVDTVSRVMNVIPCKWPGEAVHHLLETMVETRAMDSTDVLRVQRGGWRGFAPAADQQSCNQDDFKDRNEFKTHLKRTWDARVRAVGARLQRAREIKFNGIRAVQKMLPGASQSRRLRDLTRMRLEAATKAFAASAWENALVHAASINVMQEYMTSTAGWTPSSSEAGYLTEISQGVFISSMCRQPKCGLFGMDKYWINKVDSKHFRCPQCSTSGACSAQKVLPIAVPVSRVTISIPCKWLNTIVEMKARDIQTGENLRNFMQNSAVDLSDLLTGVGTPLNFTRLIWNSEIEHVLSPGHFPETQRNISRTV